METTETASEDSNTSFYPKFQYRVRSEWTHGRIAHVVTGVDSRHGGGWGRELEARSLKRKLSPSTIAP